MLQHATIIRSSERLIMNSIYLTNIPSKAEKIKDIGIFNREITLTKVEDIFLGGNSFDKDAKASLLFHYENYYITFDGNIYNRSDLKSSLSEEDIHLEFEHDEELFLKAYSVWGEESFNRVNGIFSVVIYDTARNEIICARDKLGVKPLYYTWKEGRFEVCSLLKPLIGKNYTLSEDAVSIYLSCGYVPSPYTILAGINKLQAGHILKIDLRKKSKAIKAYWQLMPSQIENLNYEEAKHKVHELLKDAVKVRIDQGEDFGCFLSGGIDSALVTAIASKLSDKKIKTFTVGFEEKMYDESKVAKQFSDILGTKHHIEILTKEKFIELLPEFMDAYDEPFADSSALPSLLLDKATKKQVSIALAGDGGDEGFLGYPHFDSLSKFEKLDKIPYTFRNIISKVLPKNNRFKHILSIQDENKFIERIFLGNQELLKNIDNEWLDISYSQYKILSHHSLQKAADLNIQLSLENDSNVKVDRASRTYGLEVRSPFLDYRIIELARNLPVEYRFSDGVRKKILRDILEIYIPRDVFEQPKKGFSIPLADWLRTVLKSDVESQLNDSALRAIPNLNVKKFKKMLNSHFKGEKDYSPLIWRVYVLVLWINKNRAHH